MATRGANRASESRRDVRHESFLRYRNMLWLKVASLVALLAIVSYALVDVEPRHNGGSWYGYMLGTIAALLILWLTLIGLRKRAMTPGRWSLKAWVSAHVYLGVALVFIATLHTGFQLGWNVHTLAWALMMVVVLSGVFGVTVYGFLPRFLSDNRDETTEDQMVDALRGIDRRLTEAAQPLEARHVALVRRALAEPILERNVLRRVFGAGRIGETGQALAAIRGEAVRARATDPALESVEALLSRKFAALDRARRHMRARGLLEFWLYIHIPLTFATLAALSAHIVSVFFYW